MQNYKNSASNSTSVVSCNRCAISYCDYKRLLEHLYWKHGTESKWCNKCGLKKWSHAIHICNVLPIDDKQDSENEDVELSPEREADFCFCRKYVPEALMIGCDSPRCVIQWYHFKCVGIVKAPDGKWMCPECVTLEK